MASLLPSSSCSHCLAIPNKILRCSRCFASVYCDTKCQVEAFKSHKKHCKKIGEALKKLKEREKESRLQKFLRFDVPSKGRVFLDSEHMGATITLSEHYHQMGLEEHSKAALEFALNYRLTGLKILLYQSDTTELYDDIDEFEWDILFNYIALDRIQDAYDFIVFWINPDYWAVAGKVFSPRQYQNIKYFFMWEQKRYKNGDMSQVVVFDNEVFRNRAGPIALFFALVLINAKILNQISDYKKRESEMDQFMMGTDQKLGQDSPVFKITNMEPVISKITKYVMGCKPSFLEGKDMEEVQQRVTENLVLDLHLINKIDPHGLYALTEDDRVKNVQFEEYGKRAMITAKLARPIFKELDNKNRVVLMAKKVQEHFRPNATKQGITEIANSYQTGDMRDPEPICWISVDHTGAYY